MSKFEWNLKLSPSFDFIRWNGVTFQLGVALSYSFLNQEHYKLIIFDDILTFLSCHYHSCYVKLYLFLDIYICINFVFF